MNTVGTTESVGDALMFWIRMDDTKEVISRSVIHPEWSEHDANFCTMNPPSSDGEDKLRNNSTEIATPTICNVSNQLIIDPDAGLVQVENELNHLTGIDKPDIQNFKIESENLPGFTFVGQHEEDTYKMTVREQVEDNPDKCFVEIGANVREAIMTYNEILSVINESGTLTRLKK